ncbi:MAG TPA: VOC family protein [Gemmatimonadales bacterium]
MARLAGILECCIYADDLAAAEAFYAGVLGLEPFAREPGRHVFFHAGPTSVFLVFDPARTSDPAAHSVVGGVPVPRHGATGPGHVAFSVAEAELPSWRERLVDAGVAVEAEIEWPRGGRSIYVRDPAGNSVELATPRIWGLAEDR